MASTDDGGSMVCPVDGVRTRISCVTCGRPICPKCAVTSPVGLTCGQHPQRMIRFVRWSPARGPVRPSGFPVLPFLFLSTAIAGVARFLAAFFVALVPRQPWIGIAVFVVIIAAITAAFLYWLLRRF